MRWDRLGWDITGCNLVEIGWDATNLGKSVLTVVKPRDLVVAVLKDIFLDPEKLSSPTECLDLRYLCLLEEVYLYKLILIG